MNIKYVLVLTISLVLSCKRGGSIIRIPIPREAASVEQNDLQPGDRLEIFERACDHQIQAAGKSSEAEFCKPSYLGEVQFLEYSPNAELVVRSFDRIDLPPNLILRKSEDHSVAAKDFRMEY